MTISPILLLALIVFAVWSFVKSYEQGKRLKEIEEKKKNKLEEL